MASVPVGLKPVPNVIVKLLIPEVRTMIRTSVPAAGTVLVRVRFAVTFSRDEQSVLYHMILKYVADHDTTDDINGEESLRRLVATQTELKGSRASELVGKLSRVLSTVEEM